MKLPVAQLYEEFLQSGQAIFCRHAKCCMAQHGFAGPCEVASEVSMNCTAKLVKSLTFLKHPQTELCKAVCGHLMHAHVYGPYSLRGVTCNLHRRAAESIVRSDVLQLYLDILFSE